MTQLAPCADQTAETHSSTIKPLETPNSKSNQDSSEGEEVGAGRSGAVCSSCGMSSKSSPPALSPAHSTHGADDSESDRKNIVFFGETGVGKSSVINMLREGTDHWLPGSEVPISSGAVGCTFSSVGYDADVDEERYKLWDTAGLNEGARGAVTHRDSVENLAKLLHKLGGKVHLLVYCIRGKRFRQVIKDNYDLFYRRFCNSKVPIVVVVTGLENEEPDMDSWKAKNEREFGKYGLKFDGWACITATRGKPVENGHMFDEEYEESRKKVRLLIKKSRSDEGCPVLDIRSDFEVVTGREASDNGYPQARTPGGYPTSKRGPFIRSVLGSVMTHLHMEGTLGFPS